MSGTSLGKDREQYIREYASQHYLVPDTHVGELLWEIDRLRADADTRRAEVRNEAADWFTSYPFPSSDSDWERGRDDALAWVARVLRDPDPQRGAATGQGLDVRLTEHRVEVLNEALDSIRDCLRAGGQQQKGLLLARRQILALIDGTTPEPPRRNVSHKQVAARCRQHPGEWQIVGEYANDMSAGSIVSAITKGGSNVVAYEPAGAFEARSEQTETGTVVYARYVGDGGAS